MPHTIAREPRGMKTKIKWFKEVLELEPGSKVFFPLARLYYEDGLIDEAEETLLQGLERNPDHLEARFLLVEILSKQDESIRAADEVATITKVLSRYPAFWKAWSETAAPQSRDSAMALSFLAANFQGRPISWSQVIAKGLDAIVGDGPVHAAMPEMPEATENEGEEGPTTRTRTMADLLAEQGDFQGALDIYEELLAKGEDDGDGGDLPTRIALMRAELGLDDAEDDLVEPATVEAEVEDSLGGGSLDETVAEFLDELSPGGEAPKPAAEEEAFDDAPDFDELADLEVAPDFDEALAEGDAELELEVDVESGVELEAEADVPTETEEVDETGAAEDSLLEADSEIGLEELDGLADVDDLDAAVEGLEDIVIDEAEPEAEVAVAEEAAATEESAVSEEPTEEEKDAPAPMPGKEALMQTLEALADRLEARSAL